MDTGPASPSAPRQRNIGWWWAAWLVALVYTTSYGWQISQHTAIPYFDQTNYVWKVYAIAEKMDDTGGSWTSRLQLLNPRLYLSAEPANRPPLMMLVPAAIAGTRASPHLMAYSWLVMRMAALLVGMWLLAVVFGNARWVPAALAVILGSPAFLTVNPALYLMDLPFASLGLLAFGLIARALIVRTTNATLLAASGGLALVLVKPQGLAFLFPLYAVLGVERLVHTVQAWQADSDPAHRCRVLRSFSVFASLLALLVLTFWLVMRSPYGIAVERQYAWGSQGYWQPHVDSSTLWFILTGLVPPWVVATAAWGAARRAMHGTSVPMESPPSARLWLLAVIGGAWWLLFNLVITYAIDPRVIWAIGPVLVAFAMALSCGGSRWATGVTILAIAAFALAEGIALFGWPRMKSASPGMVLGPPVVKQTLVEDVGIRPLVASVEREVRRQIPAAHPVTVMTLMCDEYVEYAGMNLAARWANGDRWSDILYEQFPWGADGFDIPSVFGDPAPRRRGWFLTKQVRKAINIRADAFITMHAIDALIEDPSSPIHGLFDPVLTMPVRQPRSDDPMDGWLDDSVTLWRQTRSPTMAELHAAAVFVEPRYRGTVGEGRMTDQRKSLERAAQAPPLTDLATRATKAGE